MEKEKLRLLDSTLLNLNTELVCSVSVNATLMDSLYYKIEEVSLIPGTANVSTGCFGKKQVITNYSLKWNDLRVFDTKGNELVDLAKLGFEINGLSVE